MLKLSDLQHVVILTGAGISAESGIKTFRASDGLWENHRIEDVATPEAFRKNPDLVHEFYNRRRAQLKTVEPNAAHKALVRIENHLTAFEDMSFTLITQNVDDLHERAGSKNLIHMHGELKSLWCLKCGSKWLSDDDVFKHSPCPHCQNNNCVRPDIVWFGEMPYHMERIEEVLQRCDLFVSIGTSGHVYPAAGFVQWTPRACFRVEINPESTAISDAFDEHLVGPASIKVPDLVQRLMAAH